MTSDNIASNNVFCCKNCGSVRMVVHPTKTRGGVASSTVESRVTCLDCASYHILNDLSLKKVSPTVVHEGNI